jgi:hypothetical protein
MDEQRLRPTARVEGLVVQQLGDESLVFDRETDIAHCLSADAASVWRACDGTRDLDALATATGASQELVIGALSELAEKNLLVHEAAPASGNSYSINRREALTRMAKMGAGAAAIPLIYSVTAATPAMAASVGLCSGCNHGEICTGGTTCAPIGVCITTGCAFVTQCDTTNCPALSTGGTCSNASCGHICCP